MAYFWKKKSVLSHLSLHVHNFFPSNFHMANQIEGTVRTSVLVEYRICIALIMKNRMQFLAELDSRSHRLTIIFVSSLASSPRILRKTLSLTALWLCFLLPGSLFF